jgi:SAM-dependent methyltransferase
MSDPRQAKVQKLQTEAWERGDATSWFEDVYSEANRDTSLIPWSESGLNPHLRAWAEREGLKGEGQSAVVIGCGLGDNAEYLAGLGFTVTAFDISPTAVAWCREKHQATSVKYVEADLFSAAAQLGQFDFVLEVHTLQALPRTLRVQAATAVAALVRQRLLVICRACDEPEPQETVPWPLTRAELQPLADCGLTPIQWEDFLDQRTPPSRRFRIEYRRAYTKS